MDQPDHQDYYVARAAAARELARRAATPAIAAIHTEMAVRYDVMANRSDMDGDAVSTAIRAA